MASTIEARDQTATSFERKLWARGINRRSFLQYSASLTAVLALPPRFAGRVAKALQSVERPGLLWLEFQDCAGNTESFLRAHDPSVADIILDLLSVDYHETIMAAAGHQAEAAKEATIDRGDYIVVVEGSVPTKDGGVYCTIAGKTAVQHLEEAAANAIAIINVGTCASYGGIPAAKPNPTGATGVPSLVSGVPVINLPGCPVNVENLTATLVHYLTFDALPATDSKGRPFFAYGERIHDHCERRAHFDAGQFAVEWGDDGHRAGWCLYKMGCKGPSAFHNCPSVRYNQRTSWPIGAGHGCVGCSEPGFWDTMSPFYGRLPNVLNLGNDASADKIGVGIVGLTAAGFAAHGVAKAVQHRAEARRVAAEDEVPITVAPATSDEDKGGEG